MNIKRVLIDMDNVLAYFSDPRVLANPDVYMPHPESYVPGFFRDLSVMVDAQYYMRKLFNMESLDLHIVTRPLWDNYNCYSEKARWVSDHFPYMTERITMTQNKKIVEGDIIIDDEMKWIDMFNARGAKGIHFKYNSFDSNMYKSAWDEAYHSVLSGLDYED